MLHCVSGWCCVFFFSSRRRHTRFDCDWSSDVCSSDLLICAAMDRLRPLAAKASIEFHCDLQPVAVVGNAEQINQVITNLLTNAIHYRSEERRVGKSVDLGGRRIIKKKKKKLTYGYSYR